MKTGHVKESPGGGFIKVDIDLHRLVLSYGIDALDDLPGRLGHGVTGVHRITIARFCVKTELQPI